MAVLTPKDHAEAVAVFRASIIGALVRRELCRGDLRAAFRDLAAQRFRPPGSAVTRSFSVPTLERWYYAHKKGGLDALRPAPRSDRGRARELTPEQRQLLCDIRREHPSASVPLILRTLVADGRLAESAVSASTLRRLFRQQGLDRISQRASSAGSTARLRWQAERPGALWHGDVCHGPALLIDGVSRPLRIHALLDDASRFIVAIEARHTERETDMLSLLVKALRRYGPPDALYLDNGPTYSGETLRVACARLGIALLHARPYDPQARGKMERFWRSLREGCLDHLGTLSSLHDVQVRLLAFLDQHYHRAPHAGLMGRSPDTVFSASGLVATPHALDDEKLRDALTVRSRRRVRRDCTVSVDGVDYELDQGFLAGRLVVVARTLLDETSPWVEHEGKTYPLRPTDPVKNARRPRPPRRERPSPTAKAVPFDPAGALLDLSAGRNPRHKE